MVERLSALISESKARGQEATEDEWKGLCTCAEAAEKALGEQGAAAGALCQTSCAEFKSNKQVAMLTVSLAALERYEVNDSHVESFLRAWALDGGDLPDDMADKMTEKVGMLMSKLGVTIPTLKMDVWVSFCKAVKEAVEASSVLYHMSNEHPCLRTSNVILGPGWVGVV